MEHVVFFPARDGLPAFRRLPSLEEAVRFVEHLRNAEGIAELSVHVLTEVPLAFKTWYRVEVPTAGQQPAATSADEGPVEDEVAASAVHVPPGPAGPLDSAAAPLAPAEVGKAGVATPSGERSRGELSPPRPSTGAEPVIDPAAEQPVSLQPAELGTPFRLVPPIEPPPTKPPMSEVPSLDVFPDDLPAGPGYGVALAAEALGDDAAGEQAGQGQEPADEQSAAQEPDQETEPGQEPAPVLYAVVSHNGHKPDAPASLGFFA